MDSDHEENAEGQRESGKDKYVALGWDGSDGDGGKVRRGRECVFGMTGLRVVGSESCAYDAKVHLVLLMLTTQGRYR